MFTLHIDIVVWIDIRAMTEMLCAIVTLMW